MAKGKRQETPNLKQALQILAVLLGTGLVLVSIFLLSRCEGKADPGTLDGVAITDEKTGIKYVRCPLGIGAYRLTDEYLVVDGDKSSIVFYSIYLEDSKKFISEAKDAPGGSYVYRAESEKEITLEGFAPVSAGIYMYGINAPIDNFYGTDAVEDALKEGQQLEDETRYVEYIKTALLTDKEATPTGEYTDTEYYIRLYSKNYPGLYYEVMFCTDVNGVAYLMDMVTGRLVVSPDELTVRITG